ncbi:MAG TPA: hypothetical protein VH497_08165 [Vicinamibacterales bacterium]|jgi:hypothetical protein
MQRIISFLIASAMALGGYAARAAGDSKAAELLAQARAAIGGDKVSKVQGLSCAGTVARSIGDRQISGELTLDLQLPDKMLRTDSISPMGDSALVITEQGINGDTLLRGARTVNTPPGAIIRTPPPPPPGSDAEVQALRNSRAELARLAIGLLMTSPASLSVDFTYGGEAESPDGKADVIDAKGGSSFAAKLFLDKTSHRPLMMAYRGASPRMVVQTQRVTGTPPPDAGSHGGPQALPTPEIVDINLFFDDYKNVDGVQLPHHISRSVDGQTVEELTCKTIKLNPAFKPDAFAKK